ncbi:MAG: flagellar protein FlaG [Clostridium sp.]
MEIRGYSQGGQIPTQEVYKGEGANKPQSELKNNQNSDFTKKDLDKALSKLNKFLEDDNAYAEYSVHDKFPDVMIKVIDSKTKEVLMEVPPKKILDMVAKLCEMAGVVFDKKA